MNFDTYAKVSTLSSNVLRDVYGFTLSRCRTGAVLTFVKNFGVSKIQSLEIVISCPYVNGN